MSADTSKLRKKIAKLNKSLDELESQLEPLFAQSLDETLLGLDTIQQAKMQVIIPYVVYDLVFVYLKTRGVDPMTHPVIAELDRVRQYFDKIQKAEESDQKRKLGIDKQAAGRFIKHAIAQAKNVQLVDETEEDAESSTTGPSTTIPVKVTAKMLERAEYEKKLKETADEEEEDLEVFGENVEEDYPMDDADELPADVPSDVRSADKGKEPEEPGREQVGSRHKRPRIDPFAGYDPEPAFARAKSKSVLAETHSERSTPASSAPDEPQSSKSSKKKSKRKAKK
ncbi:hypothetical protein SCLCIDRAFT_503486 [Scleroderma citrinum Foug A]|uniref:Exosome complex protein n=1 Tax=Scleroderma citrinum Foug A TaxID=1036808 RepID=A0A0C3EQG8_9AGAM|nr:hypothetical protein SCLCIDRAFT_503486 [Scleroderma citrinum Foug A]